MVPNFPDKKIEAAYNLAREYYAQYGIDTDDVIKTISDVPISLNCWQGDDVTGFETSSGGLDGSDGIQTTGNYPGRARNGDELRRDLKQAMSLLPGVKRVNLHAIYAETHGKRVDRDKLTVEHFSDWIAWAKTEGLKLDFNGSFFSHPKVVNGLTLSSPDKSVRDFWIQHGKVSREISAAMGKALGSPCVNDLWIPDGMKDSPADRWIYRKFLKDALDEILSEPMDKSLTKDALESKLFGIGSESYVVGSHEFYLSYCMKNDLMLCLDAGHFHPTEGIFDKLSAILTFSDEILLHVTRGVRWDSDHVVSFDDETQRIFHEIIRGSVLNRVNIALDFFDASINRVAAWVIGTRAAQKALLVALLEPVSLLKQFEMEADFTSRLALIEDLKSMPFSSVYDYWCLRSGVIPGNGWMTEIKKYERDVLSRR
ncbi:L-rhamnose isomerase [candidate division KSB1 bacterium]|nr:L-rhamnose isomerase [candidate division KSB1 bacterium]